ncbi:MULTISPECIES: proline--tRNA ligase [Nosocomiicoccus]|uniref:proline--tRNA ligase n=1 Tax=Nosocomiicoccus TaxID=489909 RepID=UPI0008A0F9FB|nr:MULTISPECIES: proline--tRNA ligase [Nosocomiicoccus]MDK6863035.1 proline--tRNA ligase [Nosocomiicoccus ampullae]OFS62326.1 proline--tRNA ligase [Nosocomiicoccus sp. HMSC09A07]
MRQSKMFIPTQREVPASAESLSHQLMLKSGMIKQLARGVYTYLPITKLVLQNIENIVREEMNRIDGNEVQMPVLAPRELWEESGRWEKYGKELMRLKDRHDRDFLLGPTHEEVVVDLVRDELRSYKRLPLTIYQIQTKFRDELRPRFGLLRGREFIMKDAYSFHIDQESLSKTYQDMYNAYEKIFTRFGLDFRAVEADSGAIGGSHTHEFMALSEIGEDTIVFSENSDYAANIEKAACLRPEEKSNDVEKDIEKVDTPNVKSCSELADLLGIDLKETTKTMVVNVDGEFKMIVLRGDHELNTIKLKSFFNSSTEPELADQSDILEIFNAHPGSLGPVNSKIPVYIDYQVEVMKNFPVGANEDNYHFINVNLKDVEVEDFGDFRFITEGEMAPDGSGPVKFREGIEVGQVFELGTEYSEALNLTVLNERGQSVPVLMGCYGIGISRALSAIIEKYHDENGIMWPKSVTPFDVHIVMMNVKKEEFVNPAEELYDSLSKQYKVLLDDRDERAGVKFNDSDLIGIPVRVVVGRGIKDGVVEVKFRNSGKTHDVKLEDLESFINEHYN